MPQDKLSYLLQSLHQFRPTKPSQGFTETGLGRLEPMVQNTWKLPDISSLHNADRTGTISFEMCKLLFLQKDIFQPTDQFALQARGRRPRLAGPSGAQRRKPRQRQDKPTRSLRDWWSLSGSNR
ncbi:hypothetical protein CPJ18_26445 [Agrobacterium rosae]|uniref:Uncharacterized protein n=1 Tax=Agrobacterium rosae TaxID=1972867 RepID=A0AAE5RSM4_9HYPH|nr:hypothetical protein CPJ18_26445 [Agrobacterium rosae]